LVALVRVLTLSTMDSTGASLLTPDGLSIIAEAVTVDGDELWIEETSWREMSCAPCRPH